MVYIVGYRSRLYANPAPPSLPPFRPPFLTYVVMPLYKPLTPFSSNTSLVACAQEETRPWLVMMRVMITSRGTEGGR